MRIATSTREAAHLSRQPAAGRVVRLALLALLAPTLPTLSGCMWFAVGRAAAGVTAAVIDDAGDKAPVRETGERYNPASQSSAERLQLEWQIPVTISQRVQAALAVGDRSCLADGNNVPTEWTLRHRLDASVHAEAWRVDAAAPTVRDATPGRSRVGALQAESLAARLGLPPNAVPAWLLIAPAPGAYVLTMTWSNSSPGVLVVARPCITGWVAVPLEDAIALTMRVTPSATPQSAFPSAALTSGSTATVVALPGGGRAKPNTSDEGVSLGELRSESGATVTTQPDAATAQPSASSSSATTPAARDRDAEIADRLGLLGVPEYDLVRLHQAAVNVDLGARQSGEVIAALQRLRADRLARLRAAGLDGYLKLCDLALRQGLAARSSSVWGGDTTVPQSDARACKSASLGPGSALRD